MIPGAGTLRISLSRHADGVRADVTPPETLPMAEVLRGKTAEEAATFVPLIFNICAAAQEAAARSALGLPLAQDLVARVRAETLREHAVKLLMTWPELLGVAPDHVALSYVARALDDAAAAADLRRAVFGPKGKAPEDWGTLQVWMSGAVSTPAATLNALHDGWDSAWGRTEIAAYDIDAPVDWPNATQDGTPVDNGPAARVADTPLMQEIAGVLGRGMLWRMAARLVEVERLLDGNLDDIVPMPGIAQAARGAMLVRAALDGGAVNEFARLSLTDFALVPGGVMDQALASLPAASDTPLDTLARMVVDTVDPCVATEVETADA